MRDQVNKPDTDSSYTNEARRQRQAVADQFAAEATQRPEIKCGEYKDPRHQDTWDILRRAARSAGFTGRFFYRTARKSGGMRLWAVARKDAGRICDALETALFDRACGSVGAYVEARQFSGLCSVYVHIPSEE